MPTVTPTINYLSYEGLAEYDRLLKLYIGEQADTTSLHTVKEDKDARKIYFYKEAEADITDSTAPAFTIDYSDIDTMIGDLSTLLTTKKDSIVAALNEIAGADTVSGSFRKAIKDAIEALDTEKDVELVSVADDVVTIKAIKEVDGIIAASTDTTKDVTLDKVAKTGTAADVAIVDKEGLLDATNVEDAIAELAGIVEDAEAAGKVTMEETSTGLPSDVLKKYDFYQGVLDNDTPDQKAAKKIGTINLAKDLVVTAGEVIIVDAEHSVEGLEAGTYLKLTIANQEAPVYINVADLAHDYTVEKNATQVQLVLSDDREISATIVAKSVTVTELADDAIETAKIKNSQVTADKLADTVLEQFPGIIPLTGNNSVAKLFE